MLFEANAKQHNILRETSRNPFNIPSDQDVISSCSLHSLIANHVLEVSVSSFSGYFTRENQIDHIEIRNKLSSHYLTIFLRIIYVLVQRTSKNKIPSVFSLSPHVQDLQTLTLSLKLLYSKVWFS